MGDADLERAVLEPNGFEVIHLNCRSPEDVIKAIDDLKPLGLLVQYAPITREVIKNAQICRGLVRYGIGLDNVDLIAAKESGFFAHNVPDYGVNEVADHAMSLVLSLLRGVHTWSAHTRNGNWPTRGILQDPAELRETTLGLFGFGQIARAVASRAKAFGMKVVSYDPFVESKEFDAFGVERVGWDSLWKNSNLVSIHAPLTDQTRGIVNKNAMKLMQPGSYIVNTARAGLIDRADLEAILKTPTLFGVGLDVWWQEPADQNDELLRNSKVVVTPHIAWISPGSIIRLRTDAAKKLLSELQNQPATK
jgi:D-3-phosphoglycerate dehydrogenase